MSRTLTGRNWYDDTERARFVVYRSHGGVTRKTSVRYGNRSWSDALWEAINIGIRLREWPAERLAEFKF